MTAQLGTRALHQRAIERMRRRLTFAGAMLCAWCCANAWSNPTPDAHLMHESFQRFDQSNGGWRTFQVHRDYRGAADAIRAYLRKHLAGLTPFQRASLSFHLAHIYALEGNRSLAIRWFQKSNSYHAFGNPAYPESFVAFLQNDRVALLQGREVIATTNPGPWRIADLKEVDALVEYFGDPFEAAWGALMCHGALLAVTRNDAGWHSYCAAIDAKYRSLYLVHGVKLP